MKSSSPNILLLFTDQQRADTIGALGNPLIKTPVLDRLVREGTSFSRAYTPSPVCVPARFAVVTGLAPHQTGVTDNVAAPQNLPSFMAVLSEHGYQTHGAGKMHFAGGDPRRPWGFETRDYSEEATTDDDYAEFLRANGYGHVVDPHGYRSEHYYLPQPSQVPPHLHHSNWVADRSIDFLKQRDPQRPFFLWSSFIKPHPPWESPNPWSRLYRSAEMPDAFRPPGFEANQSFWNRVQNRYKYMDGGWLPHLNRTQRAAYYATISYIDFQIGRILEALGDEADNTLIVFSSDHGEMLGDFGCYGKRCMLDGSARIPMLLRYPRAVPAGKICNTPVSLLDLFPTFVEATGTSHPRPSHLGENMVAIAQGEKSRAAVFGQFSERSLGLYMAAESDWKYIYSAADRRDWLFNLREDPQEAHNLAGRDDVRIHLERLRRALWAAFEKDGYLEGHKDGAWRDFGVCGFLEDERAGLLLQDPVELEPALAAIGPYQRPAFNLTDLIQMTTPRAMDPTTGKTKLHRS